MTSEIILPKCPEELEIYGDEPDLLTGEAHGYIIEIKRHPTLGHLCGYIDVPNDHPWAKCKQYDVPAKVHGGITFGPHAKVDESCFRIGFDCAHYLDYSPGMLRYKQYGLGTKIGKETYKNMEFVMRECEKLAAQAKEATKEPQCKST